MEPMQVDEAEVRKETEKLNLDGPNNTQKNENDNKDEKTSADYYFDSYSHFGIHEEMLKDAVRTKTYQQAIMQNLHLFKDKIVLDIGAGTGILCLFAAKAGAKKVYGIECAGIAKHAKTIVKENGFENIIEIIQGKVEEIQLPVDKVDVIISEWMGYFLLYESMLNTVLYARDKWLAPDGILMPDRSRLFFCAIEDADYMHEKIHFWENVYGFKMNCLKEEAIKEPLVDTVPSRSLVTDSVTVFSINLYKAKIEELNFTTNFILKPLSDDYIHALVAYFDVDFSKCHKRTGFTTAPFARYTHWKQTVFYLDTPLIVSKNTVIKCNLSVKRNKKNHRDLDINIQTEYTSEKTGTIIQRRSYFMR